MNNILGRGEPHYRTDIAIAKSVIKPSKNSRMVKIPLQSTKILMLTLSNYKTWIICYENIMVIYEKRLIIYDFLRIRWKAENLTQVTKDSGRGNY